MKIIFTEKQIRLIEEQTQTKKKYGSFEMLYNQIKKNGFPVKYEINNDPNKSQFIYSNGLYIWKNPSKNGGFPLGYIGPNGVKEFFKFSDGGYKGQPLQTTMLISSKKKLINLYKLLSLNKKQTQQKKIVKGTSDKYSLTPTGSNLEKMSKILYKARNASWNPSLAKKAFNSFSDMVYLATAVKEFANKNSSINPKILKAAISQIMRESKGSPYQLLNPKEILGFIHNIFGGQHSQGYSQIQPAVAKEYGIDPNSLYTLAGSLKASYKILLENYNKAKSFYSGPSVTIYKDGKLIQKPALDNDAALHMAVAAHNAGAVIIDKWCETDVPNIANPCKKTEREYMDGKFAKTKKDKVIPNYFPNKGGVHNYMPQFFKSYNNLTEIPSLL